MDRGGGRRQVIFIYIDRFSLRAFLTLYRHVLFFLLPDLSGFWRWVHSDSLDEWAGWCLANGTDVEGQ
ncbi:hypothetical protein SOASR014_25910 [Pectobacterium carotovorum subsp. carotovorum]|nr:hypothetical protein SOASR014_25910 [Pectobacterium carotovorum subsp. carotovorum]